MTIRRQAENTKLTLNKGDTIHQLENVIIDSNLEFHKHINAKINKVNSMFSII